MLWFYTRDGDSLRLQTRYDHQTLEYVGTLTHPDGHEDTRCFATARAFRDWLVSLDTRLIRSQRVQCDEIWSFVGAKEKNASDEKKAQGWGDCWTWTALDADSKLMISFRLGDRTIETAYDFMQDLAARLANRIQLTTDGHKVYLAAVDGAFGGDIDYSMLVKIYGTSGENETRYSPAKCLGCIPQAVSGDPDPKHVSTSYVERQDLTMRMSMKRFARLSNGFSTKWENHAATVSLYFMYYHFGRVHQTLRVTPAIEAGIAHHVRSIEEIVGLLN